MNEEFNGNIAILQLSPLIWSSAIKYANDMARDVGKCLDKNFDFELWFTKGTVEHDNIQLAPDFLKGISSTHNNQIQNEYTYKVAFVDKFQNRHSLESIEEIETHPQYRNEEIIYIYRIYDITHFSVFHLQNWLLFEKDYHRKRWSLYLEFLLEKCTGIEGDIYKLFWNNLLIRIDHNLKHLATEDQYQKFTEYNDYFKQETLGIWDKFIKIRDSKNC